MSDLVSSVFRKVKGELNRFVARKVDNLFSNVLSAAEKHSQLILSENPRFLELNPELSEELKEGIRKYLASELLHEADSVFRDKWAGLRDELSGLELTDIYKKLAEKYPH